MTNALGAYIQHRYLNPSQPQMRWWEGMPMRAACTPQLQYNYPYPVLNAYCPSPLPGWRNIGGGASGLGFFPGLGPLSIIGGSFSETFDWVKGIIWLAGGAMGGYVVGYLWRELRTAGPVSNRRRRARRYNGRRHVSHEDVIFELKQEGFNFNKDFFQLTSSEVDRVLAGARATGYQKSKGAPGSRGRMYYGYLQRIAGRSR